MGFRIYKVKQSINVFLVLIEDTKCLYFPFWRRWKRKIFPLKINSCRTNYNFDSDRKRKSVQCFCKKQKRIANISKRKLYSILCRSYMDYVDI